MAISCFTVFIHWPQAVSILAFWVFELCLPFFNFHIAPPCLWFFLLFSPIYFLKLQIQDPEYWFEVNLWKRVISQDKWHAI